MHSVSIVFFDIDGTLLDHETMRISDKSLETLKRLKEKGIKICIATGRPTVTIPKIPGISFDAYLTFNGSYCFTDSHVIVSKPICYEDVDRIIDNASRLGRPVAIASKDRLAANGMDQDLEDYYRFANVELKVAEDFDTVSQTEIYQMMMGCRESDHEAILEGVRGAKITAWWDRAVDIIPLEGGKGAGIQKILEHFKINKSEAMAFGDGNNDIDMLKNVGFGIAMGNASEQLKAIAYDICGSVTDDGIYHYCMKKGLI